MAKKDFTNIPRDAFTQRLSGYSAFVGRTLIKSHDAFLAFVRLKEQSVDRHLP